jgi:hypothetical protein
MYFNKFLRIRPGMDSFFLGILFIFTNPEGIFTNKKGGKQF